tara:strand:- start:789 stop:938 length:150 start_codon:yes stop_codon:yes gene_type:complete
VKKPPFTLFFVKKSIFIAIPIEDDGRYDAKLVFLLGKMALEQHSLFDII